MIRMSVLGLQISHLLLIHTHLGYGTLLMAACTCQGRDATDYFIIYLLHEGECQLPILAT
jgi:hypothetical protein